MATVVEPDAACLVPKLGKHEQKWREFVVGHRVKSFGGGSHGKYLHKKRWIRPEDVWDSWRRLTRVHKSRDIFRGFGYLLSFYKYVFFFYTGRKEKKWCATRIWMAARIVCKSGHDGLGQWPNDFFFDDVRPATGGDQWERSSRCPPFSPCWNPTGRVRTGPGKSGQVRPCGAERIIDGDASARKEKGTPNRNRSPSSIGCCIRSSCSTALDEPAPMDRIRFRPQSNRRRRRRRFFFCR